MTPSVDDGRIKSLTQYKLVVLIKFIFSILPFRSKTAWIGALMVS